MENENYQKELFEFKAPKKATARFGNMFQRNDLVIVLTAEKMVFTAIGIIMLMVVFFALGVEKGKAANYTATTIPRTIPGEIVVSPVAPVKAAAVSIVKSNPVVTVTNITHNTNPVPAVPKKTRAALDKSKPYMIVAGAFSRKDFALKEVDKLKANGLEAFVYYGEPYYLACVGSFNDKGSAKKILNNVKRICHDAYVRLK